MSNLSAWSGLVGMVASGFLAAPSVIAEFKRRDQSDLDDWLEKIRRVDLSEAVAKEELKTLLHSNRRDYLLTLLGAVLILISFGLLLAASLQAPATV